MAHRHRMKTHQMHGWTHCVAEGVCSGASHGGVTHRDTCSCGAVRETESNGRFSKRSSWLVPKPIEVIDKTARRRAYTAVVQKDGFGLGLAVENQPNYYPVKDFPPGSFATYAEAGQKAQALNAEEFGLSREDAWRISASSMFAGR